MATGSWPAPELRALKALKGGRAAHLQAAGRLKLSFRGLNEAKRLGASRSLDSIHVRISLPLMIAARRSSFVNGRPAALRRACNSVSAPSR